MSRRVIGVLGSALLAVLGIVIVIGYVRAAEQRALAGQEVVEVLFVSQPIARGTSVDDIQAAVEPRLIPSNMQVPGGVASLSELSGTVAAVDLVAGEQVLSSRFITPELLAAQSEVEVPEGLLEVTVSLDPQRALGGQLEAGDTVAVLASFDPFQLDGSVSDGGGTQEGQDPPDKTPNSTGIILHKVLVTGIQVEQLPPENPQGQNDDLPDLAPTGNLLVTLALDAPSLERLVFTAEHGMVWLAAETEDDPEDGTQVQTRLSVYGEAEILVPQP